MKTKYFQDNIDIKLDSKENRAYVNYKRNAERREYRFDLNKNQFKHLIYSKCNYCGSEPRKYSNGLEMNGIDRVNNNKGYDYSNVITSCSICNKMKGTMEYSEFINHTKKITDKISEFVDIRNNYDKNSPHFLSYTFRQGRYLSPNELLSCLNAGSLKKKDVKYSFKVALKDFKHEFTLTKELFKKERNQLPKKFKNLITNPYKDFDDYVSKQLKEWYDFGEQP